MTTTAPPDFLQVQLSAAGIKFAGDSGTVRISNGRFSYTFKIGAPVRVLTSEWSRVLSARMAGGKPILEVVTTSAAPAKPIAPVAPTHTISPSASHTDAPVQAKTQSAATTAAEAEVK